MPKPHASPPSLTAAAGFRAAGVRCGMKPSGKPDLALLVADEVVTAAGVFTTSSFPGEPVKLTRAHLEATGGRARAVVCNAGISNVATGTDGYADAQAMAQRVADHLGCEPEEVLVASTGIIGQRLPMDKVFAGIDEAAGRLGQGNDADAAFAHAIMTTDTVPKHTVHRVGDHVVGGVAKGAGMIAPNMATMLAFMTTNAACQATALAEALREASAQTFNRMSIDSDTSTSDMLLCLASSAGPALEGAALLTALREGCRDLTEQLAWDGEGVTRLLRVRVRGAADATDADRVGRAVVDSPLVKCAVHGGDANWGRLVMAVGKSGAAVDADRVSITCLGRGEHADVVLLSHGQPAPRTPADQQRLDALMLHDQVVFELSLGTGTTDADWLGCDLSREYITINADYTT